MSWADIWNELKIIGLYLIVSILFIVIINFILNTINTIINIEPKIYKIIDNISFIIHHSFLYTLNLLNQRNHLQS